MLTHCSAALARTWPFRCAPARASPDQAIASFAGSVLQSRTLLQSCVLQGAATRYLHPRLASLDKLLQSCRIGPRHCWRGLHLDAVRNWMPVPFVKPLGIIQVPLLTRGLSLTACDGTAARLFRDTQKRRWGPASLISVRFCGPQWESLEGSTSRPMAAYKAEMGQLCWLRLMSSASFLRGQIFPIGILQMTKHGDCSLSDLTA